MEKIVSISMSAILTLKVVMKMLTVPILWEVLPVLAKPVLMALETRENAGISTNAIKITGQIPVIIQMHFAQILLVVSLVLVIPVLLVMENRENVSM